MAEKQKQHWSRIDPDMRQDPGIVKNRVISKIKHSQFGQMMSPATFKQYLAICDALDVHQANSVLEIIIDAQYNDMCQSGDIVDEEASKE